MFAMTCKTFMARMYSTAATSDLFIYHRWSVPPPSSPSLSILQAHLTHKRNFSVFDPSNGSRLLKKNSHVLSPPTSTNLRSDPSKMFNSIVLPYGGTHALTLHPPSSISVHELGKPQPVQTVRAAPFRKNIFITGFCCTSSFILTASSALGDTDQNFITVFPMETFLAGEGMKQKDSSALVYSSDDLLGGEVSEEGSYRCFHDGLVTFKSHRKDYLAVPVVENFELQINIFVIGRDGTIEPVRNLRLHEDRDDIEIPQGDECARLCLSKLGDGCLSVCMEELEEEDEEDEEEGGEGGEGGEEDNGGEDEDEVDTDGDDGEGDEQAEATGNSSGPRIAETYYIFYDVSAKDPASWSLCSTPPPVPPPKVPCSLSVDPTGEYSVSRDENYRWSLQYKGEELCSFSPPSPEPLFFNIQADSMTATSTDRFIYIKASPLKDSNALTDNIEEPVKVKKKKNGGGRMAKDAGTKGMKLKMRKRC